ncbi:MAG: hypothetical protein SFT91_05620 [Rickettsiaceae bacterium]|nr:hypothetical protein [Rickettsiaceae bacterium]
MQILEDRVIIKAFGKDAKRYLQSTTTNDIEVLTKESDSIYAYFLNAQGRFLYDSFIIMAEDGYFLDVNKDYAEKLLSRLDFYKLNMKVNFSLEKNLKIFYQKTKREGKIVYKDSRYEKMGYRCVSTLVDGPVDESYLEDKYEYSIPDGFTDLVHEKSLPPEFGCDFLSSVSYTKGCYTGQEVISRTKYQGVVRKNLYKLTFKDNMEDLKGEEIVLGNEKIGYITSSWKDIAIALLKTEKIKDYEGLLYSERAGHGEFALASFYQV